MLLCGAQVVVDIEYNSSTATRASGLTGNTDWRGLPGHHEQVSKPRALLGITSPSHNPDPLATSQCSAGSEQEGYADTSISLNI